MNRSVLIKRGIVAAIVAILGGLLWWWCSYALSYNYPKLGKLTYCKSTTEIKLINATRQLFGEPTGEIFISNHQHDSAFLNGACDGSVPAGDGANRSNNQ